MPLSDYQPERKEIRYKEKPLVRVRGLNMEDVGSLMRQHLPDLQMIYRMYNSGSDLPSDTDVQPLLFNLLSLAPLTAAKMIALAADEDEEDLDTRIAAARRLSAPLQMMILTEIVKLTAEDVGGPLELRAMLASLMSSPLTASNSPTSATPTTT